MNHEHTVKLFHGTTKERALSISSQGFTYNKDKIHWLGDGIYFFVDIDLAEEWSYLSSKKEDDEPAIVTKDLKYKSSSFLHLDRHRDYGELIKYWYESLDMLKEMRYHVDKGKAKDEFTQEYILFIVFLDMYCEMKDIDFVVATFGKSFKNVLKKHMGTELTKELTTNGWSLNSEEFPFGFKQKQICIKKIDLVNDVNVAERGEFLGYKTV